MFSVNSRDMRVFTGANSVSANTIHMWMSAITTSRSLWAAVSSYCAHLRIYSKYCLLFLHSRRQVVTDLPADGSTGSRPLMFLLISKVRNTPFVSSWFCIHSLLWWSSFSSSEVVFSDFVVFNCVTLECGSNMDVKTSRFLFSWSECLNKHVVFTVE